MTGRIAVIGAGVASLAAARELTSSGMEGYYDPYPLLSLRMPLTLVGHPGAGVLQIGHALTSRTGLPFNHVARSVEAMAGRSRSQLMLERGRPGLSALEAEALRKAVARRPCGVIVLDSGLFEDRALATWLESATRLVYVRRPERVLWQMICKQLPEAPGNMPDFILGAPENPEALRQQMAPRTRVLEELEFILDAGDQHPGKLAELILESIEPLMALVATTATRI